LNIALSLECSKNMSSNNVSVFFQVKKAGGLSFNSTCALSRIDEKLVQMILHEYKIFNAEVSCFKNELFIK